MLHWWRTEYGNSTCRFDSSAHTGDIHSSDETEEIGYLLKTLLRKKTGGADESSSLFYSVLFLIEEITMLLLVARNGNITVLASIQSLVVAAAFRLRQSTQAEACGYKNPYFEDFH